jgi:GGDEF domain-containing protein
MSVPGRTNSVDLQRRERNLTIFACAAIGILSGGVALLMYPAVFSQQTPASDKVLRIAFFGFCGLCALLTAYIWDSQVTIGRLRRQMESDRRQIGEVRKQASADLLRSIPKLGAFQDLLAMESRRTTTMGDNLSVLVVTVESSEEVTSPTVQVAILGDAAKAISRKLREQDSIYLLGQSTFGVILPSIGKALAKGISARIGEGLADAAGASSRFSYKIHVVSYVEDAASARELQEAIRSLIPNDSSLHTLPEEVFR